MAARPIEVVSRLDFRREVVQAGDPVLVNFYGVDNGKNRIFGHTFDALAAQYDGRVRFVGVDTTVADLLCADWRIRNTPTVMLFIDGRPVKRWANEQNADVYRRACEAVLARIWAA